MQPLTWLVVGITGWVQRDQQAAIVYLLEENRVLKARLRGRKLRLTDDERHRLAVKGKALGRKLLAEVVGIGFASIDPVLGVDGPVVVTPELTACVRRAMFEQVGALVLGTSLQPAPRPLLQRFRQPLVAVADH